MQHTTSTKTFILFFFSTISPSFLSAANAPQTSDSSWKKSIADKLQTAGTAFRQTVREERRAFGNMNDLMPGRSQMGTFKYMKKRAKTSGMPVMASTVATIVASVLFERVAQTHSRARPKKWAALSFFIAALYGAQLRQRGEQLNSLSPLDAALLNRMLLLFGVSVGSIVLTNLIADWYYGNKMFQASFKHHIAWGFEMGMMNVIAAVAAYGLDKRPVD
ncbi:MAG: hypothetical protein QG604_127 [Candidatus Dependentiae bacterium]|nr:hypothetical protein [Candidatus Dependentiae bacterium]